MKKSNVLFLLAAGALMFTACSDDEPFSDGEGTGNTDREIVLQVANGGDGLSTRAGRPLLSSEAKQSIENVKVIITDNNTPNKDKVIFEKLIADWNTAAANYGDAANGHGKTMRITIPAEVKFADKQTYTVYAVGYHNASAYSDIATKIANVKAGDTFAPNTLITASKDAEEIFAGSYDLTTKADEGFRAKVILNRQVAGVFTYLSHVPYYDGAKYLKLYASDKNSQLVLGHFANTELLYNGDYTDESNQTHSNTQTNVINGATNAQKAAEIYTIDLEQWFTSIKDADNDNLIDLFDGTTAQTGNYNNWKNPYRKDDKHTAATFVKGSVFGGCFIIPFKATTANTFELKMTDAQDNVLQTWVIKLGDTPFTGLGCAWDGSKFDEKAQFSDNAKVYSVFRNHLYGVGRKIADGNTDPNQPDPQPKPDPDPDPNPNPTDPDVPTPINKKHELVLKVNDNWEVIHHMDIE